MVHTREVQRGRHVIPTALHLHVPIDEPLVPYIVTGGTGIVRGLQAK